MHDHSTLALQDESEDLLEKQRLKNTLQSNSQHLQIMVCQGPYTFNDSLTYQPLQLLVKQVQINNPDILVMMGPFVDESNHWLKHPLVEIDGQSVSY